MPRSAEPETPGPFSPRARASRKALRARSGAPYLFPQAVAGLAAFLLWRYWDRLVAVDVPTSLASPETQVKEALAHQDRAHLADVYGFSAGGVAELSPVRFAEIAVGFDGARQARVVALVEAQGRVTWRDEAADLSYIGRETFGMTPCSIALWCGDGRQFEQLRGVLTALFRLQDAWNGRDADAAARLVSDGYRAEGKAAAVARLRRVLASEPAGRLRITGWQIRVERDRAEVGEDERFEPDGGTPQPRRARLTLAREGTRWLIVDGLPR